MTLEKYQYLYQFILKDRERPTLPNRFSRVSKHVIKEEENRLGFQFPDSLKEFWLKIGSGILSSSIYGKDLMLTNEVLDPKQIADIMLLKEKSDYILPEAVEYIEEGYIKDDDVIFFEVADMSSFLVMKPSSDKPDAVYDEIGNIIEEHFERFIWRLYHESPDYYLRVNNFF